MIVGMITGKKVFWNCSVGVITSRVEYRSSVFIKTVFKATFSLDNDGQFFVKLVAASTGAVLKF